MHSGFAALRGSLPMNLKLYPARLHAMVGGARPISNRIYRDPGVSRLNEHSHGPWLYAATGRRSRTRCTRRWRARFRTYDVKVDRVSEAYCEHVLAWPDLREWWAAAQREPEQIEELDIEF